MSISSSEFLGLLFLREQDLRSVELIDTAKINKELEDIMVDVIVIFSKLPVLLDDPAVIEKWSLAFENLFGLVKGLRDVMESTDGFPSDHFHGRQGRIYLPIEAEYFLTFFFHEFYDNLAKAEILGSFDREPEWREPTDDLLELYRYVRDQRSKPGSGAGRKSEGKRLSNVSHHRPSFVGSDSSSTDKDIVSLGIKEYLDTLVNAGSATDPSLENLMAIAKAVDRLDDSGIHRFFLSFRRREFAKLYAPVQNSVNGQILVQVLAKYYFEFSVDPRIFNPPTFETIVKDISRDHRCDSDVL